MSFRLGYNIDAEHAALNTNRQSVADSQIALHSPFALLLDDYKSGFYFTKQIQARSPETDAIHRRYWAVDPNNPQAGGWDGSLHRAPGITAENIINALEAEQNRYGVKVIEQLYCEPNVHGAELTTMLNLIIACIKEAARRGMRLAIDIGQPVTWMQSEIDAGAYDGFQHTMAQYPQMFLSVHEYGLGDLWFNTSNDGLDDLAINGKVDGVSGFLVLSDEYLKRDYIYKSSEAHLGRLEIMAQRCRNIGVPVPKVIYTEIGWDRTRISQQDAVDKINGRVAMGYPTLAQYWKVRYPQWSRAQTAFEQVKWLNRAMPDYVVGACLFGFDTAFENGQYHLEDADLQQKLVDYSSQVRKTIIYDGTTPVPPTPQPINPRTRYTPQNQALIDAHVRYDPQGFIAQMAGQIGWKLPQDQ